MEGARSASNAGRDKNPTPQVVDAVAMGKATDTDSALRHSGFSCSVLNLDAQAPSSFDDARTRVGHRLKRDGPGCYLRGLKGTLTPNTVRYEGAAVRGATRLVDRRSECGMLDRLVEAVCAGESRAGIVKYLRMLVVQSM